MSTAVATKFQKWQIVSGSHRQNGKTYKKGQKFITDADMGKFNTLTYAPKYKLLGEASEAEILQFQADKGFTGDSTPIHIPDETEGTTDEAIEPSDSLEAMTIADLKALADDESIDLTGVANKKADIVNAIRIARAE